MPRPLIYHVALVAAPLRHTVGVVAGSCKQSQITSGYFAALLEDFFFFKPPGGFISCVTILYNTLCKETRAERERPVAL